MPQLSSPTPDATTLSKGKIQLTGNLGGTAASPTVTGAQTNAISAAALATNAITLGYVQITATTTVSSGSSSQVTGLTVTVTIPVGGRRVRITGYVPYWTNSAAGTLGMSIWDGTVGTGTQLTAAEQSFGGTSGFSAQCIVSAVVTPAAGSKTYNIGALMTSATTITAQASTTAPAYISVEAI